jgi:RNA polymerase sigma factor (sigma-70 family)
MSSRQENRKTPPIVLSSTLGLAQRVQGGDDSAWDRLDAKLRSWLGSLLASDRLPNGWTPEDVIQLVLLDVVRGIASFQVRGDAKFRDWVATVMRHTVADLWRKSGARKRGRGEKSLDECEENGDVAVDLLAGPSTQVRAREIREALELSLGRLVERHRTVLALREETGLSFAEIQLKMGYANESTARSLYLRARAKRAELMKAFCDSVIPKGP